MRSLLGTGAVVMTTALNKKPPYDPWRDADDVHIPVGARVQQVGVAKEYGALSSRKNHIGLVMDHRGARLHVQFDNESVPVTIRPHLVRIVALPKGR